VRRIRDESPLTTDRVFERGQHAVEAPGEPAELVVAFDLDPLAEVAGRGHTFGCSREPAHGTQGSRRDERRDRRGGCDADPADEQDPELDAVERSICLVERHRGDDRAATPDRRDELPQVDVADGRRRVCIDLRPLACERARGHRKIRVPRATSSRLAERSLCTPVAKLPARAARAQTARVGS
jgi:hypothetical protein